jgi:hypothetical protein
MNKQKINARQAVNDIRSGMTDAELMKKYSLTDKGLESLFRKLVEAKLLEESFIRRGIAPVDVDRGAKSSQLPVPMPESTPPAPEAPSEMALAILQDIKDGRHDNEIMARHELTPGKLNQIRDSLVQSGLLDASSMGRPQVGRTKLCPFCSQEIKESAAKCIHCGNWLEPASSADSTATAAAGPVYPAADVHSDEEQYEEEKECPWEERESYGTINAYFQTASKCILTPTRFFSKLPTSDGYFNPILFVAITLPVTVVLVYLWTGLFTGMRLTGLIGIFFIASLLFVGGVIFAPIWLAIWSGILHLCLYLVGGAREGYQATFRVVSYSSVASLFNAIPFIGNLASLWGLVLTVIGLRETHKTTTGKAVGAVAIPVGIILVIALVVVISGAVKLRSTFAAGNVPKEACQALETFIDRVDGVAGLDGQAVQSEVQAAMNDLIKDLVPFNKQPRVLVLQQQAMLFGMASVAQAKGEAKFGGHVDKLREELQKTCR